MSGAGNQFRECERLALTAAAISFFPSKSFYSARSQAGLTAVYAGIERKGVLEL